MTKAFLGSVGALFYLSTVWTAPASARSVKAEPRAARGCIPQVTKEQADAVIRRFNLRTVNARPEEIRALGTGLFWIEKLNGNQVLRKAKSNSVNSYPFRFSNGAGNSHQGADAIYITRNGSKNYGQNVAQLIHELGHYVGNNGAYAEYRKAVGTRFCIVSSYSASRFNEQFAENFAAFVSNPAVIRDNKSAACQASYRYFSKTLFVRGDLADKCAVGRLKAEDYNM